MCDRSSLEGKGRGLDVPIEKVLALHGLPFAELSMKTPDPWQMRLHSLLGQPLAEAIDFSKLKNVLDQADDPLGFEARDKIMEALVTDIPSLAKPSGARERAKLLYFLFQGLNDAIFTLPSPDKVAASDLRDCEQVGRSVIEPLNRHVNYNNAITWCARNLDDEEELSRVASEQIQHDRAGRIEKLRNCGRKLWISPSQQARELLVEALCVDGKFLQQLSDAHLALISGSFNLEQANLIDTIRCAVGLNAERFEYELSFAGANTLGDQLKPGAIVIAIPPDLKLYAHQSSIALMIYNVVKNPLKITEGSGSKEQIGIVISANYRANGDIVSIFVKDTGPGISYDEMRDHFTLVAAAKQHAGDPMVLAELCLLDEMWREHVPPVALNQLLFNRGASFQHGTGIGLALVKQIIDAHGGFARIFDHPTLGAGVELLFPNIPLDDPSAGRSLVREELTRRLSA